MATGATPRDIIILQARAISDFWLFAFLAGRFSLRVWRANQIRTRSVLMCPSFPALPDRFRVRTEIDFLQLIHAVPNGIGRIFVPVSG